MRHAAAVLAPPTFRGLFEHFKGKKLPEGTFLENTIVRDFGVPRAHAAKCAQIFKGNLEARGSVAQSDNGSLGIAGRRISARRGKHSCGGNCHK